MLPSLGCLADGHNAVYHSRRGCIKCKRATTKQKGTTDKKQKRVNCESKERDQSTKQLLANLCKERKKERKERDKTRSVRTYGAGSTQCSGRLLENEHSKRRWRWWKRKMKRERVFAFTQLPNRSEIAFDMYGMYVPYTLREGERRNNKEWNEWASDLIEGVSSSCISSSLSYRIDPLRARAFRLESTKRRKTKAECTLGGSQRDSSHP